MNSYSRGSVRAFDMARFDDPEICRRILESLPTALCVLDIQKRIVFWSDGAQRITGHLRHEVIGHSCIAEPFLHCDQPGCEFCGENCPLARAMKTARGVDATGFVQHKDGHKIPVRIRAVSVHNQHGSIIGALETFEELQAVIHGEVGETNQPTPDCLDPVTGIASHAMTLSHLQGRLASWNDNNIDFTVLLLQVQGLQHFRANLGPEAASSLLRVIARTLETCLWSTDLLGRWGDAQFLMLVNVTPEGGISLLRERIRRTLAGEGIEWWGERRSLPVHVEATTPELGDTVETLLGRLHQRHAAAASESGDSTAEHGGSSPGS